MRIASEESEYEADGEDDYVLPRFLIQAAEVITDHLDEEGLFRVSGDAKKIAALKLQIEQANTDSEDELNVYPDLYSAPLHAVSGLFKQWIRELPDPVVPRNMYDEFMHVNGTVANVFSLSLAVYVRVLLAVSCRHSHVFSSLSLFLSLSLSADQVSFLFALFFTSPLRY
jgi:RhoGAP domain